VPTVFRFTEYGGPETQEFAEVDKPRPGPAEILVRVMAAGVNPVDHKVRSGRFAGLRNRELPSEFGSEISGVIAGIGSDVEGFSVGEEVFGWPAPGHGAFCEYTVTSVETTAKKPPQLSFTDAAALPVAATTAYDGLVHLGLSAGQTLLITGIGGGVGVAAAQLARNDGVAVFGTASESKRALVESLGATLIPYGEGVEQRVRDLLPQGVDGIYDLVGADALPAVARLVKDPARLITAASPATAAEFGGAPVRRDRSVRVLDAVARLATEGKLDPHVTQVVPFDQAPAAIAAVESGHPLGKIVLRMG
jgi:NADPH:quinone reductase-like Zn-dependent oxidoreductase